MNSWVQTAITIVIAILGSGGLWTYLQKRSDKKDSRNDLLLGLAHDRIVYLCLVYIERGSITQEEYESLHKYLYLPYKASGGNGPVDVFMARVNNLPISRSIRKEEHS